MGGFARMATYPSVEVYTDFSRFHRYQPTQAKNRLEWATRPALSGEMGSSCRDSLPLVCIPKVLHAKFGIQTGETRCAGP
jgi:hypothetical protein